MKGDEREERERKDTLPWWFEVGLQQRRDRKVFGREDSGMSLVLRTAGSQPNYTYLLMLKKRRGEKGGERRGRRGGRKEGR